MLKYDLLEGSFNVHPVVLLLVRSGPNIHLEGGLLVDHNARDLPRYPNLHQLGVGRPLRFPSDYHPRTRSHTTLIERRGGDKLQCPFMNEFPLANITTVACPATSKQQMLQGFMFLGHIRGLTTSNVARLNKLDLPAAFGDQRSSLTSQAVSGVALLMPSGVTTI